MKSILIPTDFSDCAGHAVQAAIAIAQKTNAEIHFLHLMSVPVDWLKLEEKEKMYPDVTRRVNKANIRLNSLVELAEKSEVNAKKYLCYNENYEQIIRHIKGNGNDFVVMGSHGASGIQELFIGSLTQKIARLSPVPVLVIKTLQEEFKISNIVFASDFEEDVQDQYLQVVDFARNVEAKLHLLYINTPFNFTDTDTTKIKMGNYAMHSPRLVESTNVYNYNNIDVGLFKFCEQKNADMIAMITHGRKGISGILVRSITESVINHSNLPVLSINISHGKLKEA